ncbi:unnamed protein product [Aphanomyces euteiches]
MFADDTTLIASTVPDLHAQLDLVEEYCVVSGARLNLDKTEILTPNAKLNVPVHYRLSFAESGMPIRYLGILFGHNLAPNYQVNLLTDKIQRALHRWGCRARTIAGRRLLVQTVVLPLIWHCTAVVVIPPGTIQRWQALINRFIQNPVTDPSQRTVSLIQAAHQYDRTVGWKTPHIDSIVAAQRLQRLHLLVTAQDTDSELWSNLATTLFRKTTEPHYRPGMFDFLHYKLNPRTAHAQLARLPPLWRDIWSHWHRVPVTKRMVERPTIGQLLNMPVRLQANPIFRVQVSVSRQPESLLHMFTGVGACRTYYKHLAVMGLHCLNEFLLTSRTWPTYDIFERLITGRTLYSPSGGDAPYSARPLYKNLTKIARQVFEFANLPWGSPIPSVDPGPPPFAFTEGDIVTDIRFWTRKIIKKICSNPPEPTRPHPLINTQHSTMADVTSYLTKFRDRTNICIPLQRDTWMRMLYRVLPVGSRFSFLQQLDPACLLCPRTDCHQVETAEHCFRLCPFVTPVWDLLSPPWEDFGIIPSWTNLMHVDNFEVRPAWNHAKKEIISLAMMMFGGTLRRLWLQRNKVKYANGTVPHPQGTVELILLTWAMQVRCYLRRPTNTSDEKSKIQETFRLLGAHPTLRGCWLKYPKQFSLTPPSVKQFLR